MKKLFLAIFFMFAFSIISYDISLAQTNNPNSSTVTDFSTSTPLPSDYITGGKTKSIIIPTTPSSHGVLVATVSIRGQKIVSNDDRNYKISFDLSNDRGVQAQVKYSVLLTKTTPKGDVFVDEKVYDETLTVDQGSSINVTVDYTVPFTISSSTYHLFVTSKNINGLPFATAYLGDIKIDSSSIKNTVEVLPESCYAVVSGDSSKTKYKTTDYINVLPTDYINLTCDIINNFPNKISLIPKFEIRVKSSFGEIVPQQGGSKDAVALNSGKNQLTFELPKTSNPQLYRVSFYLESNDQKITSNTVSLNYFLAGMFGSVDNVVFDKALYNSGDTASIKIFSSASSDLGMVKVSTTTVSTAVISITVTNNTGEECGSKIEKEVIIGFSELDVSMPITKQCIDPKANVVLSAKMTNGDTLNLDTQDYKIETPSSYLNAKGNLNIILIALLFLIILAFVIFKYKNKATTNLLIIFVFSISIFGFANSASAYTYGYYYEDKIYTNKEIVQAKYSWYMDLDTTYYAGFPMAVSGGLSWSWNDSYWVKNTWGDVSGPRIDGLNQYGYLSNVPRVFVAPTTPGAHTFSAYTYYKLEAYNQGGSGTGGATHFHDGGWVRTENFTVLAAPDIGINIVSSAGGTTTDKSLTPGTATSISWNTTNTNIYTSCKLVAGGNNWALPFYNAAYEYCSGEGGWCSFPGYRLVWYGAYDSTCPTNDPANWFNIFGMCTYRAQMSTWLNIGNGGRFACGNCTGYWGGVGCNNGGFGDPVPGVGKGCYSWYPGDPLTSGSGWNTGPLTKTTTFDVVCTRGSEVPIKKSLTVYVEQPPVGNLNPTQTGVCAISGWTCDPDNYPAKISVDLTVWTPQAASAANSWSSIAYGSGKFVAVSTNGTNRVMTSTDGVLWSTSTAAEANAWQGITYGNNMFVAVSTNGTHRVMTSPDGITWTGQITPGTGTWYSVTYGNNMFVAVGNNQIMTSPDGITWTARTSPAANNWYSVTYGNNMFVAVSIDGTQRVMKSNDGITWTTQSSPAGVTAWYSISYGNGKFVAVGSGANQIMSSPDGVVWTARNAPDGMPSSWQGITYGNNMFVAVSTSDANHKGVMVSSDGVNWKSQLASEENNWMSVTYGNGIFVAISRDGSNRVMTSTGNPSTLTAGIMDSNTNCPGDNTINHGYTFLIPQNSPLRDGKPHKFLITANGVNYKNDFVGPNTYWTKALTCGASSIPIELTADVPAVLKNKSTIIRWNAPGAEHCSINKIVQGLSTTLSPDSISNSISSGPITDNTTFTANCTNAETSAQESIIVGVILMKRPSLELLETEGEVIRWKTIDADSCTMTIGNGDSQAIATSGEMIVPGLLPGTEVLITCSNDEGNSPFTSKVQLSPMTSICKPTQASNKVGDTNLYANKETTWSVELSDPTATVNSRTWIGTNISTSPAPTGITYKKTYTTVGDKTIKAITSGMRMGLDGKLVSFSTSCSTTTKIKQAPETQGAQ